MRRSRLRCRRLSLATATLLAAHATPTPAYEFEFGEHTELLVELEVQILVLEGENLLDDPDESLEDEPPALSGDESIVTETGFTDNDSQLKFGGSYTTEDDLSAFFYIELPIALQEPSRRLRKPEDRYVGVSGKFGGLQFGAFDDAYETRVSGVLDEFEYVGTTDFNLSRRLEYLLAYWSPEFAGFSFAVQTPFDSDATVEDTEGTTPFTLVGTYSSEFYQLGLGYDSGTIFGASGEQLGTAVRLDFEPLRFALKYDTINTVRGDNENDSRLYGGMAMYEYSRGYVAAAVQRIDHTEPVEFVRENRTEVVLHASYGINEYSAAYIEGARYGRNDELGDYLGIGLILEF